MTYHNQIADLLEEIEQMLINVGNKGAPADLMDALSDDLDAGQTLLFADMPDNSAFCDWKQEVAYHLDDAGVWLADHANDPVPAPVPVPPCGACGHDSALAFPGCECACHDIFAVVLNYPAGGDAHE